MRKISNNSYSKNLKKKHLRPMICFYNTFLKDVIQ